MQLGFNENVIHKGIVYHIQTEDGGIKNPVITTFLFKEGIIIDSKKTSYTDIIKSDKLDVVVKEIMREQHGNMLKKLREEFFDIQEPRVQPQARSAEKFKKKEGGQLVSEKSLDDIILEYLSTSEKE